MVANLTMEVVGDHDPELMKMLEQGFDIPAFMGRGGPTHTFWLRQLAAAERIDTRSTSATLSASLPGASVADGVLV